jgi:hypothetical protein
MNPANMSENLEAFISECVEEVRNNPEKYPHLAKRAMQKLRVVTSAMLESQTNLADEYMKNHLLTAALTEKEAECERMKAQSLEYNGKLNSCIDDLQVAFMEKLELTAANSLLSE